LDGLKVAKKESMMGYSMVEKMATKMVEEWVSWKEQPKAAKMGTHSVESKVVMMACYLAEQTELR
jgi:bifunctional pyridoxal-dependent enzyme with beta-cystathionase and maltose regulon repressor activities